MSGRKLTPAEQRAWRAVTRRGVKPQAEPFEPELDFDALMHPRAVPQKRGGKVMKLPSPLAPFEDEQPRPSRPADRGREKRIRRGQAPIHARLDLHGHTQASAQSTLLDFVIRERHAGARCVLVITGKGRSGEGVIRQRFRDWLESPLARQHVSGFATAHQKHGGDGAFYVFLRRLTPSD
jgi:DNA-nicking Smr family endonuclease